MPKLDPDLYGARLHGRPLRELPKVSLHDHLDGGVRPATVFELATAAGIAVPASDAAGLAHWFSDDLPEGTLEEYLERFELVLAVMQTRESLERIAREFVADLVLDGVIYAEVRWAPEQHQRQGLSLDEAVEAVQTGFALGESDAAAAGREIRVTQLISAMRQGDRSLEIAELAVRQRDGEAPGGVVGFDIAGPEKGFPPSDHRAAFDYLAAHFVPVTVHAGEGDGLDSVRSALIDGRALRLGHGVRLMEDIVAVDAAGDELFLTLGEVAQWVHDREIPLELSPTSNVQTRAFAQWGEGLDEHPFDRLYQLGFAVTVNVDNRTMSRTTLTRELGLLADAFDYDLDDLEEFQLNAAAAAFLPVEQREELIELIAEGFAR